jgi:hypothetical protein
MRPFPSLAYPSRQATPDLIREGRKIESRRQSTVHAAMIAQAAGHFEIGVGEAIRAFSKSAPDHTPSIQGHVSPPARPSSTPPLPVPPRTEADLHEIPPQTPPVYAPKSPSPDPVESGEIQILPGSPQLPKPYLHPGEDWEVNADERYPGPRHHVTVPVYGGGGEEVVVAPFIKYDFNMDCPELLITLGRNCPVHSRPLRASPQPQYETKPAPPLTQRQKYLFLGREHHSILVDEALRKEKDVTLRAEVQRFRNNINRTHELAADIAELKARFDETREIVEYSARALADADAYSRIIPRVILDMPNSGGIAETLVRRGHLGLRDNRPRVPRRRESGCRWCRSSTHDTAYCGRLRRCMLCRTWGHPEEYCVQPHKYCQWGGQCKVPKDHQQRETVVCPTLMIRAGSSRR